MTEFFANVPKIKYEGPDSRNPLAFKHYNPEEEVGGKKMRDHFRFSVCFWHTMKNGGADPFGVPTRKMPWQTGSSEMEVAENTMNAMFEFLDKLGVDYWCFHDRDIAPEVEGDFAETNRRLAKMASLALHLQDRYDKKLLWGTACLFSHPRYMAGAATSPDLGVFIHAAAQVKVAMETTLLLGGQGYVNWGGREGYDTLLNTDMRRELDQLAAFMRMQVEYKKEMGFEGQLYIEPKPKEPTKHQYDSDAASCHAFLLRHGLAKDWKLNIECNHATLAGHSFVHELTYAAAYHMLGSIDANRGDELLGWDTDQFPTDIYQTTACMLVLLENGGFTTGGLNFDAKVRRQSTDPVDLFYAHIGGMDAFARGLKIAYRIWHDGALSMFRQERYDSWSSALGEKILNGKSSFRDIEEYAHKANVTEVPSGRQELLENIINDYL